MADTMSIDLNNQEAIAELDALIAKMDEAEAATEKMAEAGELTVESQEKQIKVIHEHSAS